MNTKDIFIVVVFLAVLAGVGYVVYLGQSDTSVVDNKKEDVATTDQAKVDDTKKIEDIKTVEKKVESESDIIINKLLNRNKNMQTATLNTTKGDITIAFFADQAPNTVANFLKLAKEGFYDGIKFHRVIKGFMDQAGDPQSKDDTKMGSWGTGGPGYKFADEIDASSELYTKVGYKAGVLAMANSGPNTNGSQFFIMAQDYALDPLYTIFGKVVSGQDVVDAINNAQTGESDRPVTAIVINSITIK